MTDKDGTRSFYGGNPDTGTLYLVSSQKKVFELTTAGALMSVIDLAFLSPGVLSGVAYGPSSMNPAARATCAPGRSCVQANECVSHSNISDISSW